MVTTFDLYAHVAFTILLSGPAVTNGQHNFWVETADDKDLTISQPSIMLADFERPKGLTDICSICAHAKNTVILT